MSQDYLGNVVTGADAGTLAGINDFIGGFLGYQKRAVNVLAAADADPQNVLASVYAGFIWMFLEASEAPKKAARYLAQAQGGVHLVTEREQMLVEVLQKWIVNDIPGALAVGEAIARNFPNDLLNVKLHKYFNFNLGNSSGMLRIVKMVEAHHQDNANYYGMEAFCYEQCHLLEKAERSARRGLEINPDEPWAQHALAHVMLTQGRIREGADFMKKSSACWQDLNSFMFTHNWWHTALFDLSLGDYESVFAAYDGNVWGQEKDFSQDQIGAVALLARMEIAGLDVGDRWMDVAKHLKARARDTVQPFLTIQYLYGLARAEYGEADELMAAVEERAAGAAEFEREAWANVALPACRGVLALARNRPEEAVRNWKLRCPKWRPSGAVMPSVTCLSNYCLMRT
ncbi:MAG: tetratricopeptide repeat protein [Devosiaceae bacterium]|nr:tetratricopeptide repeat protein [Devosiaceae bacterium]